jgi:predicted nucleic acid-binding protein
MRRRLKGECDEVVSICFGYVRRILTATRIKSSSYFMTVIDATVLADLLIGNDKLKEAACILAREDDEWVSTGLWRYELGNVLWKDFRFNEGDRSKLQAALCGADQLLIETVDEVDRSAIWDIACDTELTYYDSSYVWLARSRGLVLRTRDRKILKTCPDVARPMPGLEV